MLISAVEMWTYIRDSIYNTAVHMSTFGKREKQNADWFEANFKRKTKRVIQTKRTALINYEKYPTANNLSALKSARSMARQTARHCAKKTTPLQSLIGEILTDCDKEMERWAEHYVDLYSRETVVTATALDGVGGLPVMEEFDGQPTVEELRGGALTL